MKKKEHPWQALVIKEEDLVCKLGDIFKLVRDVSIYNEKESIDEDLHETDNWTHYVASGQLYKSRL